MTPIDNQSQAKPSIALIGLRGSGKTVVGRELATLIGGGHVDTDDVIADRAGRSIADMFESEGEAGFRGLEREAVAQVVQSPPAVISVGGGAILDEENVKLLHSVATVVWLTAPVDVLWQRIADDPSTASSRPALTDRTGIEELRDLLSERTPHYQRVADITIDTAGKQPREIAAAIAGRLHFAAS